MAKLTDYLILDLSTAGLPEAAQWLDTPKPRKGTKDEDKIAAQIAAKTQASIDGAGLDPDLCQITGYGLLRPEGGPIVSVRGHDAVTERSLILSILEAFEGRPNRALIGFNSFRFDLPVLMRRCFYLGLPIPDINMDKYRSPHVDLYARLSFNGAITAHSLSFYAKRLALGLTKPLSGAEESQVLATGRWNDLAESLKHDVLASKALAAGLGII